MSFSLTILGSSSALPTSKRFPTAHLLNVNERFFLIDCGEGTQIQLRRYKARMGRINRIFISHMHGDHIFGLFGLLSSFQLLGRKNDLHIYGPGELNELITFYKNNFAQEGDYKLILHPVGHRGPQRIFSDEKVEVIAFPLKHRVPTSGYLFRERPAELNVKKEALDMYKPLIEQVVAIKKGEDLQLSDGSMVPNEELTLPRWVIRSYAYCTDTVYDPGIVEHIMGVDLLYHESTFSDADRELAGHTLHSTSVQAAEIAKAAGVKKLLLGHFSSRYKDLNVLLDEAKGVFPASFIVNDGDVFEVERRRESRNDSRNDDMLD